MERASRRWGPAFVLLFTLAFAQHPAMGQGGSGSFYPPGDYVAPLLGPLNLSGSFGEIRSRHYHMGTDLRTGAREGWVARSVLGGYVSRINVELRNYGLAVFVTHPNGVTSLYGHLYAFSPEIADYVKREQYRQGSYQVELYPRIGELLLRKGDLVGWTGNSGSSGGPHLHFELRYGGGIPFSMYKGGIPYEDRIAPDFKRLFLYGIDTAHYDASLRARKSYRVVRRRGEYYVPDTLRVPLVSGLSVYVPDRVNARSLTCNIHALAMEVDGTQVFRFDIDECTFAETAFADAHVDFPLRWFNSTRAHLLYVLPGNTFRRHWSVDRGLIRTARDEVHRVTIRAWDVAGNESRLHVVLKGTGKGTQHDAPRDAQWISHSHGGVARGVDWSLSFDPGTLYYDYPLVGRELSERRGGLVRPLQLQTPGTPLHQNALLTLRRPEVDSACRAKVYVATFQGKRSLAYHSVPQWNGDEVSTRIRYFATYTLALDTIPPRVRQVKGDEFLGRKLGPAHCIRLRVWDTATPIVRVDGFIDGSWVVMEYEPKTGQVQHNLDPRYTVPGRKHSFRAEVEDALGNVGVLEGTFEW